MRRYGLELNHAARSVIRDALAIQKGESLVITADTISDAVVAESLAEECHSAGGKPLIVWMRTPAGVAMAADADLPREALVGLLEKADAWIELNVRYLNYSRIFREAMSRNDRLRFYCLPGITVDVLMRCFAGLDFGVLAEFLDRVTDYTRAAECVRMATPAGEDVRFANDPDHPFVNAAGYARTPGSHMFPGQISWTPALGSVNGTIVFDGSIVPGLGLVRAPVRLSIEADRVVGIEGGADATWLQRWLESWNDDGMFRLAHTSYGFHPRAQLTGQLGEDERIWGCTQWGLGAIGKILLPPNGIPAASHIDGICLNTSTWLDDRPLTDAGTVVDERVKGLASRLLGSS